jgi:mevalonate kinase
MSARPAPRAEAEGRAPAKLILSGEHSVVYGHPAIAIAVRRETTVRLRRRPGPTALGAAPFADPRVLPALLTVLPENGLAVDIESSIPVGRGMGSSAALAVATVRAWAALEGRSLDFAQTHSQGFAIERAFHGQPSGVDHAVSALGGAICYRKGAGGPEWQALRCPDLPLVILDSGSAGDTAALVAGVASRRPDIDPVLARMGALTGRLAQLLAAPAPALRQVGALLDENHRLLGAIGVSTPRLDALVALARAAGAVGAKLAGAGGGGVVLALCPEPEPVLSAAADAGIRAFSVHVAPPEPR